MSYMEWFSLGLLLVLLELFVPGVYLVWFGLSAFVTGALTIYHDFTVIEQSLVFGLISVVFALTGWFFYGRIMKRSKVSDRYKHLNDPAGQHIGKTYLLAEDVVDGRSKALIGDSVWIVECEDGLKKGDKVITAGGIYGVVKEIKETTLLIEVDGNVTLRIDKNMVVADNSQLQK